MDTAKSTTSILQELSKEEQEQVLEILESQKVGRETLYINRELIEILKQ